MGEIRDALEAEPPDWNRVLAESRGLFDDEDHMIGEMFGVTARARVRVSQVESRTLILAIAATYAETPWETAVVW